MLDGFVPSSRASFMLDFVAVAMVGILPVLTWSIWLVKSKRNYKLHKRVQLALGVTLAVAVTLFEIDIRVNGWKHLAEASAYYDSLVFPMLYIHLFFAISASISWLWAIIAALRKFDSPPTPNDYSPKHKKIAWIAAISMYGTSITGWAFYTLAFML
jgi:putative membrane protein